MNEHSHLATPELTWRVATVIHERCCTHSGCAGAYLHLSEAAAAVDVLVRPRPRRAQLASFDAGRHRGVPPRAA